MHVAVAHAVAYTAHQRRNGVAKMKRHRLPRRLRSIFKRSVIGALDGIGFRRTRQIDGRLRERVECFGQAYELRDCGCGRGLNYRLRVCKPYVFGGQYAEASRYEDWVRA